MKTIIVIPNERPAFVQMINSEQNYVQIPDGYILQIDLQHLSASIINSKKGGNVSMIKTVVKALEGFEKQFDELNEMKANLENDKEIAKQEALAEVERKFEARQSQIDRVLETVSVTEEIEVADEEEVVAVDEVAESENIDNVDYQG